MNNREQGPSHGGGDDRQLPSDLESSVTLQRLNRQNEIEGRERRVRQNNQALEHIPTQRGKDFNDQQLGMLAAAIARGEVPPTQLNQDSNKAKTEADKESPTPEATDEIPVFADQYHQLHQSAMSSVDFDNAARFGHEIGRTDTHRIVVYRDGEYQLSLDSFLDQSPETNDSFLHNDDPDTEPDNDITHG